MAQESARCELLENSEKSLPQQHGRDFCKYLSPDRCIPLRTHPDPFHGDAINSKAPNILKLDPTISLFAWLKVFAGVRQFGHTPSCLAIISA